MAHGCGIPVEGELGYVPGVEGEDALRHPGEVVYTIGNPGASDVLWVHSSGSVRQVAHLDYKMGSQEVNAWVVETQTPINSGDSGGPVVNGKIELVAINSSHQTNARLMALACE